MLKILLLPKLTFNLLYFIAFKQFIFQLQRQLLQRSAFNLTSYHF